MMLQVVNPEPLGPLGIAEVPRRPTLFIELNDPNVSNLSIALQTFVIRSASRQRDEQAREGGQTHRMKISSSASHWIDFVGVCSERDSKLEGVEVSVHSRGSGPGVTGRRLRRSSEEV